MRSFIVCVKLSMLCRNIMGRTKKTVYGLRCLPSSSVYLISIWIFWLSHMDLRKRTKNCIMVWMVPKWKTIFCKRGASFKHMHLKIKHHHEAYSFYENIQMIRLFDYTNKGKNSKSKCRSFVITDIFFLLMKIVFANCISL